VQGRAAEPYRFMKMTHGHCAALHIEEGKRFSCAVYEDRPTLCRALKPGSAPCLEARARRGIDPPRHDGGDDKREPSTPGE
jgi:hypothetical protein